MKKKKTGEVLWTFPASEHRNLLPYFLGDSTNSLRGHVTERPAMNLQNLLTSTLAEIHPSELRKKNDDRIPASINDACEEVSRIVKGGKTAPFNQRLCAVLPGIKISQTIRCTQEGATLQVKGTIPRAIKIIGNESIAVLIRETVELEEILVENEYQLEHLRKSFIESRAQMEESRDEIEKELRQNWTNLFSDPEISLSIEKDVSEESGYALKIGGKLSENCRVPKQIGRKVFHLQDRIQKIKEGTEAQICEYEKLSQKFRMLGETLAERTFVIVEYFKENPIKDCKPALIAIDPKDNCSCLIVAAKINRRMKTIPMGLLKKVVLAHNNKEMVLSREIQKVLKIEGMIERSKKKSGDSS